MRSRQLSDAVADCNPAVVHALPYDTSDQMPQLGACLRRSQLGMRMRSATQPSVLHRHKLFKGWGDRVLRSVPKILDATVYGGGAGLLGS